MTKLRKTTYATLAFAVLSAAATVAPVTSANASGYGYYSQGNGYYYSCRKVKQRYWNGYGWSYRWVRRCW
ncbi:MAG: hypothetical protein R3D34_05915 [Nitratireductor sp.]|nr:hypothetical protein [Nitratireductor sp.]